MRKVLLLVSSSLLAAMALASCSSAPPPTATPASTATAPAPASVPDHTSLFPNAGKVSAAVVPDHILGMKALPGGSLADYDVKGKKYQMFIVDAVSTQNAAFVMLDMKAEMQKNPEYISYMGGYFGVYGDKPLYCFAKLHYLAGILGLSKDKADPLARSLAAQLN